MLKVAKQMADTGVRAGQTSGKVVWKPVVIHSQDSVIRACNQAGDFYGTAVSQRVNLITVRQ
ncbi:hypothetical protein TUM12149_30790 [Morganella morganii]|nr:hypothetical protein TUM12149_30790 [Morganella morganii]